MGTHSDVVLRSYQKSAAAYLILLAAAIPAAFLGPRLAPPVAGPVIACLGVVVAVLAALFLCASIVVLVRCNRSAFGGKDLFLELNRSRSPAGILSAVPTRATRVRRWLARRTLGHNLLVGDLVEVRTWTEIHATLDERGCFEDMPFMPEMLGMCGQRARVFRCLHRLFDYRKTRRMRHMRGAVLLVGAICDGSAHGGCEAACHTVWKSAWLRRVEPATGDRMSGPQPPVRSDPSAHAAALKFGTHPPRYTCQLTQLHAASEPIGNSNAVDLLRPLISGNAAPAAFVTGWLTHLFNKLQRFRGGEGFPSFGPTLQDPERPEAPPALTPGDQVIVRSAAEIRATLDEKLQHRGLWFEPDMMKYLGQRCQVRSEVRKVIDVVTGEMIAMKTPAYILRDVHFSGERQLFNAQYEPLFWRGVWLRRQGD